MATVISKDGTPIAYSKTGKGQPLIIIDGALCSRAFGPTPKLVPLLSEHFTVISYDRRGRNESGDTLPYSVEREIEDIDALIKEAGGLVFMTGFSSGAALALHAAGKGLAIKKLLLYEAPYVMNMGGHNPPADAEEQFKKFIAEGRRGDAVKYFMKDLIGMPAFFPFIMSMTPVWTKLKLAAHTLPYDAAVMGNYTVPAKIASSVTVPALVAGGEKSPISLRNAVQQLGKAIPDARIKMLEGQNHNVSAKAMAPVMLEYFNN